MKKIRGFEIVRDDMKRTNGDVRLPTRGTKNAMAYDFYANDYYSIVLSQMKLLRFGQM